MTKEFIGWKGRERHFNIKEICSPRHREREGRVGPESQFLGALAGAGNDGGGRGNEMRTRADEMGTRGGIADCLSIMSTFLIKCAEFPL